jgi:hypothetical protein
MCMICKEKTFYKGKIKFSCRKFFKIKNKKKSLKKKSRKSNLQLLLDWARTNTCHNILWNLRFQNCSTYTLQKEITNFYLVINIL